MLEKGGHESVNLIDALKKSCDCYFYNLAKEINVDKLAEFSKKFSIGTLTGIDIPDENYGLMPNTQWKRKIEMKSGKKERHSIQL